VGNFFLRIFIRIRIHILHVVQSADPQAAYPHITRSRSINCQSSWIPQITTVISLQITTDHQMAYFQALQIT